MDYFYLKAINKDFLNEFHIPTLWKYVLFQWFWVEGMYHRMMNFLILNHLPKRKRITINAEWLQDQMVGSDQGFKYSRPGIEFKKMSKDDSKMLRS